MAGREAVVNTTRRAFLAAAAGVTASASLQGASRLPIRKAVLFGMLPRDLTILQRFELAQQAGFEQMECSTTADEKEAVEILEASKRTGVRVHSVMNSDHWKYPLSSSDKAVVEKSLAGMRTSLRNAKLWGSDTVLLVPAVVNPQVGYREAWERSQQQIRKLIPEAEGAKVIIAVEEVWNKFLLSPIEFAKYVDEFNSPWIKAYFDVGNVVLYGYPQDWIRTLNKRIVKLHLKDFAFRTDPTDKKRYADWVNLREGDIDWKAVHQALVDIGYKGSATVELAAGDADYLKDVSRRVDLILEGA
jgi:L-ribulose-5-phosphate 3-epimerase